MSGVLDHGMTGREIFKLVWTGWTFGCSAVAWPLAAIGLLVDQSSQALFAVLLVPLIAAGQGVVIGAGVWLGLKVYEAFWGT